MSGSNTAVETALEYLIRILRRKSDGRKIQNLQTCGKGWRICGICESVLSEPDTDPWQGFIV